MHLVTYEQYYRQDSVWVTHCAIFRHVFLQCTDTDAGMGADQLWYLSGTLTDSNERYYSMVRNVRVEPYVPPPV